MDIDTTLNEAIRSSAMLVSYHTTGWSAKIPDVDAALAAARALGIAESSLNTRRNLMDGADTRLKAVASAQEAGRSVHARLTLPWSTGTSGRGPRMLPTMSWEAYMREVAKAKSTFDRALSEFVGNYPEDAKTAQARIDMVGDPLKLYPSPAEVQKLFDIRIDFSPIPAGTEFRGLPDAVKLALEEAYESRMKARLDTALAEAYRRTKEAVRNLVDRLDVDEPSFKSAAVENVRDLAPLLRGWNLGDDEDMTILADDIEKLVAGEDMKSLKANEQVRRFIVKEGRRILADIDERGL